MKPSARKTPAHPRRRQALGLLGAVALGPAWGMALAQAPQRFPTRPITLWLPWPAGGATDLTFRILAEAASARLGQKVLIENRGGAGGTLAMPILQQAQPDSWMMGVVSRIGSHSTLRVHGARSTVCGICARV